MICKIRKVRKVECEKKKKVLSPEEQVCADIELSLRKQFKKSIWCKFTKAINEYEMIKEGDCIAVCISGGKDSMLLAKCFQELKRHNKFPFEVKFLVMDHADPMTRRQLTRMTMEARVMTPFLNIPLSASLKK